MDWSGVALGLQLSEVAIDWGRTGIAIEWDCNRLGSDWDCNRLGMDWDLNLPGWAENCGWEAPSKKIKCPMQNGMLATGAQGDKNFHVGLASLGC